MIKSIIEKVAELTEEELPSITPATVLDQLESWDSLAKVSFLIFASTEFNVQLDGRDVQRAETIEALCELVKRTQTNAS